MAYIPTKSVDGWYVIDEDSGEPVNKEPLKSKSEALKMINNLNATKEMTPAMKGGPPMPDVPMGNGMPPGSVAPMEGGPMGAGMPDMEMMKEMIRKKGGGLPPPMG